MTTGLLAAKTDPVNNGTLYDYQILKHLFGEDFKMIEALKGKIIVVKLGGSTLEHQRAVLQDIVWLRHVGVYPILVHGGGPYINEWLQRLEIQPRFENGLRITDSQTLEIVRMVLLGQLNPQLVLMTSQMGGKAIGLSGTDGGMVRAHIADERLGFVGKIDAVDATPVWKLIETGYIPIIAPLGQAVDGTCLNINADLVASQLAGAMGAERLLFLSNVMGICRPNGELIPQLTGTQARELIEEGVITGGMIPKVQACLDALTTVSCVHILDGRGSHGLLRGLLANQRAGTAIVR